MIDLSPVPLFVGPVEMLLLGAVILVILFGSRATDIAREAGSTVGKVNETRRAAEEEIEGVRSDIQEGVEPVKEEVQAVEEEVQEVEKEVESVEKEFESVDEATSPEGNTRGDDQRDTE